MYEFLHETLPLSDLESLFIYVQVVKEASRLYAASWVRDIGPELRPNDYKKDKEHEDNGGVNENKDKEPTALEDLGN